MDKKQKVMMTRLTHVLYGFTSASNNFKPKKCSFNGRHFVYPVGRIKKETKKK